MKKIIILSLFALVGCSEPQAPKTEASTTTEVVPYVKKNYTESDLAARLDFVQLAQVTINDLSSLQATYNSNATEVKLLPHDVSRDVKFIPFNNWQTVKIIRKPDSEIWQNFLVEVFDKKSYEQSKTIAFDICKDVWSEIDERVPTVIDELAARINEYEKTGSVAMTQHIRYGYLFSLDASHYKDGYPISCSISYDEK